MKLKSDFGLIIPLTHDCKIHNDTQKFASLFLECPLKHSSQLSGSPLLENDSPLLACLELKQTQRRKVGIHQNENHTYLLIKCDIPFIIGKVKLWLFKGGIGFITINVGTDVMDDSALLDLVSRLSDVKTKYAIKYDRAVARGEFETVNTSIRKILDHICNLPEGDEIKPFDSTYKRAMCLFYGFGYVENNDELLYFLEMLRRQNTSNRKVPFGLQSDHCFNTFEYITCAISESVLAVIGDVKSAGEENEYFLTNNGGLRQSIFSNYLPVYLNCLSISLRLQKLQKDFHLYDISALKLCPKDAVCELHDIMNTPLHDLTSEYHINELFKTYLCDRALGISEKLQKLSGDGNRQYIEEIYNRVRMIDERTERMEKQLSVVANFVENDLSEWLCTAKSGLKRATSDEENEIVVSDFIAFSSDYINNNVSASNDFIDQEESYLQDLFGNTWNQMCQTSKISLMSAGVLWRSCSHIKKVDFDFSGICISATSALEAELKQVFFIGFQKYMETAYGKPDKNKWEKTFEQWPEKLLSWNRIDYEKKVKTGKLPFLDLQKTFTMGMVPFFMGRSDWKSSEVQNQLLHSRMEEYLGTVVRDEYQKTPLLSFYQEGDPTCFVQRCENVRNDYRNPAAHTNVLSKECADACYRTVVGRRETEEFTSGVTGLIMSLYGYLK
ncbi:MAG: hypothetical protein K2L07_13200 [Lachnospiraceae bacterium]|nr:hypothetical protein [Lachnospiraceae bacterium]